MTQQVKINLNGIEIEVPSGTTIRQASEGQGFHIPTFCYDDRLKPYTSCFLCVVEVENAKGMVPACSTQVVEGMRIQTDSEKVIETRRMALDLLLSDHAGDCIAPCEATCPSNVDIQGYIAHVSNGNYKAATKLIKERNPLPVVCGRICPHPCESQCRRGLVDEAVAINPLKRFAAEYELKFGPFMPEVGDSTGKKVAIVGGGPAGLTAAYYLRQMGHEAHIFEALPELGGMVRYGIPRFRLPWDKLDGEINSIIGLGVHVNFNQKLGRDFTIEDLKKKGFDAVLLATGAHKAKPMRIENEDCKGVIGGIDFLRKVVLKEEVHTGNKVAVIGGGDTAMDCARVARRLGADVILLYRRSQEEMPALPHEQEETMGEGIEFRFLSAPTKVITENGTAKALEVIQMELGEPDASGRRRPIPIEGSEEVLAFDMIISAIGQEPDLSCVDGEKHRPEGTKWNTFTYDTNTMSTTIEGVFTAGDCAFGPDTVIRAVGEGKQAAKAINLFLLGNPVKLVTEYAISRGRLEELDMADYSPRYVHKKRALENTHDARQRLANGGYEAINVGISEVQALAEATRCIECGCKARFDCDLRNYSTQYDATEKKFKGLRRDHEIDARHPFILIEADKCITCGSCVRICNEVRQISALSLEKRGFSTKITPNFGDPLQTTHCDSCGMCIDLCPTGAMSQNTGKEYGPWETTETLTSCSSCSRGCGLRVHTRDGAITKVQSIDGDSVNGAVICAVGRFSHQMLNIDYGVNNSDLNTELNKAHVALKASTKTGIIITPNLTVELIFLAHQIAVKNNAKLYYQLSEDERQQSTFPNTKRNGVSNLALLKLFGALPWEKEAHDCLILIGTTLDDENRADAKVISINNFKYYPNNLSHLPLVDPLRMEGAFLNEDGNLAIMRSGIPVQPNESCYYLLSNLGELGNFEQIENIRMELVNAVPEFKGLLNTSMHRIIPTTLKPEMGNIARDSREIAFENYYNDKMSKAKISS
ncbi:MAG: FAD-dependent oxidoreductase [Deltaproteobacteria bacterium]|nr:FAD-dependent oxidoreductase [Deltaproteobacteria bacterium]